MTAPTTSLRVGRVVAEDWRSRDLAETIRYENGLPHLADRQQANPFAKVPAGGGLVELTRAELEAVIADAGYYAEPDGPAYDDPNLRAAYRRLVGNARLAWANMPGHEAADL